jgi:hypothetical protein
MRTEPVCLHRDPPVPCSAARRARLPVVVLLSPLLALGFPSGHAGAQRAGPLYQVEVVIFAQPSGTSVEQPPLHRPTLPDAAAQAETAPPFRDSRDDDAWPDADHTAPSLPEGFSVAAMPRQLDAVARRLNTGGYQLLWHQAWIQPPVERDGSELSLLAALGQGTASSALSGRIDLTAGRFLHLGVDIELQSATGLEATMHQRRRIRPRVEQYFDHPRVGIVAVVTPVELVEVPAQSTP